MTTFELARLILEGIVALLVTPFAVVLWYMLRRALADIRLVEKETAKTNVLMVDNAAKLDRELSETKLKMEREMATFQLLVANTYVTQNDLTKAIEAFNRSTEAIFKKLERIEDKLDSKVDKAGFHHGG